MKRIMINVTPEEAMEILEYRAHALLRKTAPNAFPFEAYVYVSENGPYLDFVDCEDGGGFYLEDKPKRVAKPKNFERLYEQFGDDEWPEEFERYDRNEYLKEVKKAHENGEYEADDCLNLNGRVVVKLKVTGLEAVRYTKFPDGERIYAAASASIEEGADENAMFGETNLSFEEVDAILKGRTGYLWQFEGCDVERVRKKLSDFGLKSAPRGWRYLKPRAKRNKERGENQQ